MAFSDFLDPVLNPLLQMHPFLALAIITFVITVIVTVIYKYTTDQKHMKHLKDQQKLFQKEMKGSKQDSSKMVDIQKRAMRVNLEYMKHSFKSTLYTFIPVILLFTWLTNHFAYYPIAPNEPFNITATFKTGSAGSVSLEAPPEVSLSTSTPSLQKIGPELSELPELKAVWTLKGGTGEHVINIAYNGETYKQKVLITEGRNYLVPVQKVKDSKLSEIKTELRSVKPIEPISLLGWHPGWFGTYILLSLGFSAGLRKLMKVY